MAVSSATPENWGEGLYSPYEPLRHFVHVYLTSLSKGQSISAVFNHQICSLFVIAITEASTQILILLCIYMKRSGFCSVHILWVITLGLVFRGPC